MMEIVVASSNKGKVAEIIAALADLPVKVLALGDIGGVPEAVEDGLTFEANALLKATHYSAFLGKPCLADDSGLEVDALHGEPGVYSARYSGEAATDSSNNAKLLSELAAVCPQSRTARFRCVLAYISPEGITLTAEGSCEGLILDEPRGESGFGYDPLFYLPSLGKTLAELDLAGKNTVSHRGQALRNMAQKLARCLDENRRDQ